MEYQKITIESVDGATVEHIVVENAPGHFTSFPALDGNPSYEAFKKALGDA